VPFFFVGVHQLAPTLPSSASLLITIFGTLLTLLMLVFLYLGSRMQFVVFDIVLNRTQTVAPAWRRYGPRSIGWTAFKVAICAVVSCLLWLLILPHLHNLVALGAQLRPGPQAQPPVQFMASIFATYGLVFGGVYGLMFLLSLLCDFVLPSMALEDMPVLLATQRFLGLVAAQPAAIGAYLFVKLGLIVVGFFGMQAAAMIVMIPAAILAAVIGGIGYLLLHILLHLGPTLLIPLAIVLGLCFYGVLMFVIFVVHGAAVLFLQAFSIYFLGSRYPLLGDQIDPDPSRPFAPPPSVKSRDERDDDDGGPPLPMDPVVA
jgi:hypothetical protein